MGAIREVVVGRSDIRELRTDGAGRCSAPGGCLRLAGRSTSRRAQVRPRRGAAPGSSGDQVAAASGRARACRCSTASYSQSSRFRMPQQPIAKGLGSWLRCARAPKAVPGTATAVTESTRFAGPALALRPWRVTRRHRRRGGWPWPEGSFQPSLARQRRTRSGRHGRKRHRADQCAVGAGDEDLDRRAAPDSAAGRGGDFVLEGAEADADVDAPFDGSLDGLRVHVVLL